MWQAKYTLYIQMDKIKHSKIYITYILNVYQEINTSNSSECLHSIWNQNQKSQRTSQKRKNKMKYHREWWCSQWTINNCLLHACFKCIHYISFIDFRWYDGHHLSFPSSNFSFICLLVRRSVGLFISFLLNHLFVFASFLWKSTDYTARIIWCAVGCCMPMFLDFILMENLLYLLERWTKNKILCKSHHSNSWSMVIVWSMLMISWYSLTAIHFRTRRNVKNHLHTYIYCEFELCGQ